jgi:DNA processing protein
MNKELLFQIGLTLIKGVGPITAKKLVSYCGGSKAVFHEKVSLLQKIPNVGTVLAKEISSQSVLLRAEKELKFIEKNEISVSSYLDDSYPYRLKNCQDSPILLYSRGKFDWNTDKVISIVGTRKATSYGKKICDELIQELAQHSVLVVSGLAYGIDICAHQKALKFGLPNIGVMAHGHDRLYPAENANTAKKMLENGGLVSEFISGTTPERENFVRRNRIVAGISDATIVVESSIKGGAMITAQLANSYNRDVFAVPERVGNKYFKGCNHLIKSHQANLLTGVKDLEYILGWDKSKAEPSFKQTKLFDCSDDEQIILDIMRASKEARLDEIITKSGFTFGLVASVLMQLEFKGAIMVKPGKTYLIK